MTEENQIKTPNLFLLPKDSGITEKDREVIRRCGLEVVEVNNPKNFFETVVCQPVPIPADMVTKAMWKTIINTPSGRENFGYWLSKSMDALIEGPKPPKEKK